RRIDGGGPVGLERDVVTDENGGLAEFASKAAALRLEHVADHHLAALGDHEPRLRGTLPARAAADQHDPSCHSRHDLPPQDKPENIRSSIASHGDDAYE